MKGGTGSHSGSIFRADDCSFVARLMATIMRKGGGTALIQIIYGDYPEAAL